MAIPPGIGLESGDDEKPKSLGGYVAMPRLIPTSLYLLYRYDFKVNISKLSREPLAFSTKIYLLNCMCFGPNIFSNVHFPEKQLKKIEGEVVNHVRSC